MAKKRSIDYSSWSKDELIKEIKRIRETTYGLVWHRDVPEEKIDVLVNPDANTPAEMFANEVAGKPFPVLKEIKEREIESKKEDQAHLMIEGDNYHALATLNFTHQEAVDMIYIDPPYNTGKDDFRYNDRYVDEEDPYRHSKWLSFMDKRLKLAKNLLRSDGFIFISIDDHEQAPLKLLCDEIFGEKNFIQNFMWLHGKGKKDRWSRTMQQYILCYAKDKEKVRPWGLINTANYDFQNPDNDPRGGWFSGSVSFSESRSNKRHKNYFTIESPSGIKWTRQWQKTKEEMNELLADKKIFFGYSPAYDAVPRIKIFPGDVSEQIPPNIIDSVDSTREAQAFLDSLFGEKVFDYPKPVSLIKHLLNFSTTKDAVVVDFMAGSGTTGHAVLELNREDGGSRQFILCTNNENNIATDVCYPRLKKIINGYKNGASKSINGLGGNLKYFTAYDFVESKSTDRNKRKLVKKSTEMLCIKEGVYDLVKETEEFKILKNPQGKYLGIIFYEDAIDAYKKEVKKLKKKIITYVFSLGDDPHRAEFEDVADKVELQPIPEVILRVYKEIFK